MCLETPSRRIEIAQYVLPRWFEAVVNSLKKQKYAPKNIKFGGEIVLAVSMGIIAHVYHTDKKAIKINFNWLVEAFAGKSDSEEGQKNSGYKGKDS